MLNNASKSRGSFLVLFISLIALGLPGCQSDLLSLPPAADSVELLAAPAETITSNSIIVDFSTSEPVVISIEYGTVSGTYTGATPRTVSDTTSHSVEIVSLDPSTNYFYRVVSYLDGARAFPSEEFSFTTDVDPAFLLIASGPTVTPALTSLDIDFTSNSACTSLVVYGTAPGVYTDTTILTGAASTIHSVTLSGLTSGTTYYYRIKMFWDGGVDFVSNEFSTATSTETEPTAAKKARGIWVLGGLSGAGIATTVANVDLYDPVTNAWFTVTTLPTPVSFAAYAAAEGKLFVIGGFSSAGTAQSLVQIYTIATNSWSAGAVLPAARANIKATVSNGKIYVQCGSTSNAAIAWAGSLTNYEYNIGGNVWNTRVAFVTTNTSERFSYAYNDVIYGLAGRSTATAVAALAHDAYVPASNLLSTGVTETIMATNRSGVAGDIYIPAIGPAVVVLVGGVGTFAGTTGSFVGQGATTPTLSNLQQYLAYPFAAPSAWTIPTAGATTYPSLIAYGAAAISTAVAPARFYYFGGVTSFGTTTSVVASGYWSNVPVHPTWNGDWTAFANLPSARWGHGAITLNQ